mgnify:FL=1
MGTISRSGITGGGTIQATHITNIIDALDGTSATTTVIASGSFSGSLTGTLTGTASFASSALSASYAANVPATASYALTALSSSYAVTASYALNAGGGTGTGFPFTGSAQITGSMGITGSLNVTGGVTASLVGTASYATTAQQAEVARVTTNAAYYPVIVDSSNATAIPEALKSTANITMNPSTNTISATTVSGSIYASSSLYATGSIDGNVYANSNFVMDLNELGKTSARGTLVLPIYQPTYPVRGSVYVDFDGAKLYLYDGSAWVSIAIA